MEKKEKEFRNVSREFANVFNNNFENRPINPAHLAKVKQEIRTAAHMIPAITVNKVTYNVIDGQHRLRGFKELVDDTEIPSDSKLAVMFVELSIEDEKEAIIKANTVSKNWSIYDFIGSHSKSKETYVLLDKWCDTHTLCVEGNQRKYRYATAMLKGKSSSKLLKEGHLELTDEDIRRGDVIHAEILEITKVLNIPRKGSFFESMIIAWSEVREFHPFKEWLKAFRSKKTVIAKKPYANRADWDSILSLIHISIDLKNK